LRGDTSTERPAASTADPASDTFCAVAWTWRYEDAEGGAVDGAEVPTGEPFPTQSDAETWLGENWRELLSAGVEQVSLLEGGRVVYGPMSLRPSD
jgi:hypothetical protein